MKKEMIDTQEKKEDRNPEKRKREAHMRFEEERMVELKQEYPTLKMSQLKEKIWKEVILRIDLLTSYSGLRVL
jgi:Coiled-coil domain-containing protein 124 /Oxs1